MLVDEDIARIKYFTLQRVTVEAVTGANCSFHFRASIFGAALRSNAETSAKA
jgi:hypothetical protein